MFAPAPKPISNAAPVSPCLGSFHVGASGVDPMQTADPIMAALGSYFAEREAARLTELEGLRAKARLLLAEGRLP